MVNTAKSCFGSSKPGRLVNGRIYCMGCEIFFTLKQIKFFHKQGFKFDPAKKYPRHIRYDRIKVERP